MQLINTIEISPYDFSAREYDFPAGRSIEFPDEWDQFWKKCISDKNLGRIEAIKKGSYLVDITTINDDELVEIVKNELKDVELPDFEEQVSRMYGGIVLIEDNKIYIEPGCCGDIGNISGWESIFEKELNTWNQLWIGHPWIFYRNNNEIIEFSNYTESNPDDFKVTEILITVSASALKAELIKARENQNDLEVRIRKALEKMEIEHAEQISKLMAGNI